MTHAPLGWLGIIRLGLVQTALGSIVVLTTSTINRIMVVELALPAMLPGALVAFHYALQLLRPRWGHGSDVGGRRTPWIIAGMVALALGGVGAAVATATISSHPGLGLVMAVLAFALVGVGVGAAGTSLLALLAARVAPERRAPAATIVWLMMIAGFVVTTILAGSNLDPFSMARLIAVTSVVSAAAVALTLVALWNLEGPRPARASQDAPDLGFAVALQEVWSETQARRFTVFVFLSMLAYSMQDLILEPFAGVQFGYTPGASTKLAGVQHAGVFSGMVLVALAANPRFGFGSLRAWVIGGCIASCLCLLGLAAAGTAGGQWPLQLNVFALGIANGAFAIAAIGSMMTLAGAGRSGREGIRMGLWGAAQAIAFAAGGFVGAAAVDALQLLMPVRGLAYASVFALEALAFLAAARLANSAIPETPRRGASPTAEIAGRLATRPG